MEAPITNVYLVASMATPVRVVGRVVIIADKLRPSGELVAVTEVLTRISGGHPTRKAFIATDAVACLADGGVCELDES